jgi:hypothetical protein
MVHTDSAWCSGMIHSIRHILLIMMINWLTIFSENRSVMRLWFCNDRHVSFLFHISLIFCGLICSVIVVLHIGKFIWSVALLYFVRTERVMNIFIVLRNERKVFRICQFHERSDKTEKCTECVNREVNENSNCCSSSIMQGAPKVWNSGNIFFRLNFTKITRADQFNFFSRNNFPFSSSVSR